MLERAAFVLGLHVEQFVNVEQVPEAVRAVEDLMVLPDAGQHGPEDKRI